MINNDTCYNLFCWSSSGTVKTLRCSGIMRHSFSRPGYSHLFLKYKLISGLCCYQWLISTVQWQILCGAYSVIMNSLGMVNGFSVQAWYPFFFVSSASKPFFSDVNIGCHIDHIFTQTILWTIFLCLRIAWHKAHCITWMYMQLSSPLCSLCKLLRMVGHTIQALTGRMGKGGVWIPCLSRKFSQMVGRTKWLLL